jgi:Domain of unknown function (DUF4288)
MYDKNISPVGWYVCSYLLRFIELANNGNYNEDAKFLSWENTIIVKASSIEEAYDKTVAKAQLESEPYKSGPKGVEVQWVFEGITSVLPIYEEFEDGAEIIWCEHNPKKLKTLKSMVGKKQDFLQ